MAGYCTLDEMKAQIKKTKPDDDVPLQALIDTAKVAIDAYCNRPDGFAAGAAVAREFVGSGGLVQRIDECAETPTLVAVKASITSATYTAWALTDWMAATGSKRKPNFNRTPYTMLVIDINGSYTRWTNGFWVGSRKWPSDESIQETAQPTVQVTAKWSYSVTPPDRVKQANIIQASRWYMMGKSGFAKMLANVDQGALPFGPPIDDEIQFLLAMGRLKRPALGGRP